MRPIEALLVWTFAVGVACFPLAVAWKENVLGILPFGAQALQMDGRLGWSALVLHAGFWTVGGMLFLILARRTLESTIRRSHEEIEDPTVKDLLAFPAFIRWRRKHLGRLRVGLGDTLLAGQVQTSMLTVAAPMAVLFAEVIMLLFALVFGRSAAFSVADVAAAIAFSMPVVAALMGCVEACGVFAREKARHTAAVIASTPEGGPAMLLWKGGAVVYTQALPIVVSLVLLPIAAFQTQEPLWHGRRPCGLRGPCPLSLRLRRLVVARLKDACICRGAVGLALFVVAPVSQYVFLRLAMESPAARAWLHAAAGVGFLGCWRSWPSEPRPPSAPVLCVSVGAASALWPFLVLGFAPQHLFRAPLLALMSATFLVSGSRPAPVS